MTEQHVPNKRLMADVLAVMARGPMTVAGVTLALREKHSPWDVRQAIVDLEAEGQVMKHTDGRSYKRVPYCPDPEAA